MCVSSEPFEIRRTGGRPLMPEEYFFGEDYRIFNDLVHVVDAAWLFLTLEFLVLALQVVVLPLTISSFDAATVVQILLCGSALLCAICEMFRHGHVLFWPFLIVKVIEVVFCVLVISLMTLLLFIGRKRLLQVIRWKFNTVDHSNESVHIAIVYVYFCILIFYCLGSLRVIYAVAYYFKSRAISEYEVERKTIIRRLTYSHPHNLL